MTHTKTWALAAFAVVLGVTTQGAAPYHTTDVGQGQGMRGFSVLTEPNSGRYVGTVVQDCHDRGAEVWVYLSAAYPLHGHMSLVIQESAHETPAIQVNATDDAFDVEHFGGHSQLGCLSGSIVLTLNYGGRLKTMYQVLGQGAF
jgi:hypothetical protein